MSHESKPPKRQESSGLMSFIPVDNGELYDGVVV